jgi:hypothetical protein
MSNTFNIKRTETNGDGVALYSVAHPRPTNKIDVIIDALSVAQNSVWSMLNQEALAYAIELKLELAKPEQAAGQCGCGANLYVDENGKPCSKVAKPEQAEYDKLTVKFGERAKEYLEVTKNSWQFEQKHTPWCDYLNIMLTSMPPQRAKCNCKIAEPEQEEPLSPVDIGVDVTPEGTHVVACYNRPDAVQEMFYSQFHPLAKPEQEPKLTDAGADTNISRRLEPKGSGMVTLNQVGMRVDLKDAPQRKEWVGLTDDEINKIANSPQPVDETSSGYVLPFAHAIEAKLKEKNNAHT